MKIWLALCVKEWKDSRYLMGFLLVALVALQLYGWYDFDMDMLGGASAIRGLPFALGFVMCIVAPPFLLARSFSSEFKAETHYQWFALPVQRWITVVCKYAMALSNGLLLWLIALGSLFLFFINNVWSDGAWGKITTALSMASWSELLRFPVDLFVVFFLPALLYMMLLLALVTVMEGVKFSVNRFQGGAALVTFAGTIYLYARFYKTAVGWLDFLGGYDTIAFWAEGAMKGVVQWGPIAYAGIALSILIAVGLSLFEKRVEI